jgi:threonine synthase
MTHSLVKTYLTCSECGNNFAIAPFFSGCPNCAKKGILKVLEVAYEYDHVPPPPPERTRISQFGKYANLLPGGDIDQRISLGEGSTPLIPSKIIGRQLGLKNLFFKNESVNPTWSFKDRYVSVTVNVARSLGYKNTIVASTGNLGVSAAAFSAAAGMKCLFIAPDKVSSTIIAHARLHRAIVAVTNWEDRHKIAAHIAERYKWFPIALFMPMPIHNPFGVEGYKTIGYEIIEDLGCAPAAVLFPCARGNGLYGTWKGFKEARNWGWIKSLPSMVSCQPIGANSLEESIRMGASEPLKLPPIKSVALSTAETVADAHALASIRESRGFAFSASEEDIIAAVRLLGQEGLCLEPASALPVACLSKIVEKKFFSSDDLIVCVLTATGIKWPEQLKLHCGDKEPTKIDSSPEAIEKFFASLNGR